MSYTVDGRIEVSVFINNVEFPLDSMNTLNYLHIAWTTRSILPTFRMGLFDQQHILDKYELPDGIPVRIVVKPLGLQSVTFNFRKYDHKKSFNGKGFIYDMDGYLDFPKYWIGTSVVGVRGTSNDVLQQIASTCGLNYDGISTNDAQLWMPRNRTFGEFAYAIKRRGYVSDASYMELGVNPDGTMIYRDVTQLGAPQKTIVLGQLKDGAITAMDYLPHVKSGLNNKMTGYQNARYDQSMIEQQASTANSSVTIQIDSNAPLFNTQVQTLVQRGYQSFGGIDVGNTHSNYEKAFYQNLRIANSYSLDVEFLLYSPSNLSLFDTFVFSVDDEANKQDAAYAGTYITVGRALAITGAQYSEKILGTRQGLNTPYISG